MFVRFICLVTLQYDNALIDKSINHLSWLKNLAGLVSRDAPSNQYRPKLDKNCSLLFPWLSLITISSWSLGKKPALSEKYGI